MHRHVGAPVSAVTNATQTRRPTKRPHSGGAARSAYRKSVLSVKAAAPDFVIKAIRANGLTYEEAAQKMPELIGFHEVGHNYVDEYGIRATNTWLREFLAHYFAYAFLSKKYPKTARLFLAMHEALIAGIKPKHTSLEDLNNLSTGVGAENYGWYQAQLLRMVARVYERKGLSFVSEVKKSISDERERFSQYGNWVAEIRKDLPRIHRVVEESEINMGLSFAQHTPPNKGTRPTSHHAASHGRRVRARVMPGVRRLGGAESLATCARPSYRGGAGLAGQESFFTGRHGEVFLDSPLS